MREGGWTTHKRHLEVAHEARKSPGQAFVVDVYDNDHAAQCKVGHIRSGKSSAFRPARDWTPVRRGSVVEVVYIGKQHHPKG